jgi:hypothetical protein
MAASAEAERYLRDQGYLYFYSAILKVDSKGVLSPKRVVIVTARNLQIFALGSPTLIDSFSWLDLLNLDSQNTEIRFTFPNRNLVLFPDAAEPISRVICNVLSQVLSPSELTKFNFCKPAEQCSYAIWARALEIEAVLELHVSSKGMDQIKEMIMYQDPEIYLPVNDPGAVEIVIHLLPVCRFLRVVTFPDFPFTPAHLDILAE